MKYTQQDPKFTDIRQTDSHSTGNLFTGSRSIEKRSVAETLLETISETLGQGGLRPGFSETSAARRGRSRQLVGVLAMLIGLVATGYIFLRPANPHATAGEPVAYLEIGRGRAEMFGSSERGGESSMLMLSSGEPIHAGTVIETGTGRAEAAQADPATVALASQTSAGATVGRAAFRLAGGQSLRLDSGSRVRFATSSSVVLERGALYVDSAGGDNVEVRTALGVVRDIGTQFEVRILPGSDATPTLQVRVREGSVELEGDNQAHLVVAGEELKAHRDGSVERAASPIHGPHWDWVLQTAPAPDFTGRPLADFLDWVEQESGWTVRFADHATSAIVAETILHGDIRGLNLKEAATVVLQGSGLDYRIEDSHFVIVSGSGAAIAAVPEAP